MINENRMLKEFFELVRIPCSNRAEREVADVLKSRLTALGLVVMEDDVGAKIGGNCGNVLAYLQGTISDAPVLLLSAHMDCVEPCLGIKPQVKDGGVITSDGTTILGADDKSGIVSIMEALRVIIETGMPHGDIQIVFTVAEENGGNGAKNMDRTLLKADYGYVLDSSGEPGRIIIKTPSKNKLHVVIHGRSAHAGVSPEEGVNAIIVAGKALAELKDGRIDQETTANVGCIKGGDVTNIVPDRVEIICEIRSRNTEKAASQTKDMRETFERVAALNGARAEVTVNRLYDSYVLSEESELVTLACQAAESIGLTPKLEESGGGTDANFFNRCGISTTALGTGMSKAHTKEEYIKIIHLYQAARWVIAIVKQAAERSRRTGV